MGSSQVHHHREIPPVKVGWESLWHEVVAEHPIRDASILNWHVKQHLAGRHARLRATIGGLA